MHGNDKNMGTKKDQKVGDAATRYYLEISRNFIILVFRDNGYILFYIYIYNYIHTYFFQPKIR